LIRRKRAAAREGQLRGGLAPVVMRAARVVLALGPGPVDRLVLADRFSGLPGPRRYSLLKFNSERDIRNERRYDTGSCRAASPRPSRSSI